MGFASGAGVDRRRVKAGLKQSRLTLCVAATGETETRKKALEPFTNELEAVDFPLFEPADGRPATLGCAHGLKASHRALMRGLDNPDDHGVVSVHPGKQERFRLCKGGQHVFNPVLVGEFVARPTAPDHSGSKDRTNMVNGALTR